MASGIYRIRVERGDKPLRFYVGQAGNIAYRLCNHRSSLKGGYHHNQPLQAAFNKYGIRAFSFAPVLLCTVDMLTHYEQLVLDYHREHGDIFNVLIECVVSHLGIKQRESTIEKRRAALTGRSRPLEVKAKISKSKKGKPKSAEHKLKLGVAQWGRIHPITTRNKMSESRKRYNAAKKLSFVLEAM